MRNRPSDGKWVFLDGAFHAFKFDPDVVIKDATDNPDYRAMPNSTNEMLSKVAYDVAFVANDGLSQRNFKMRRFQMPTGAASITLGTQATSATGVVTYTPTKEGYMLATDGTLLVAADNAKDIAGLLLTDYFLTSNNADDAQTDAARVLTLAEGDIFWLIVEGDVELYVDATTLPTVAGRFLAAGGTAGQSTMTATVNTGGTIAQYNTSVLENGAILPYAKSYAMVNEAIAAAGLCEAKLYLPGDQRWAR